MEGLIPMVFKAIKRNQTRRQYRCLSNGASLQSYDLFFDQVDGNRDIVHNNNNHERSIMESRGEFDGGQKGHRRFGSMGNYEMRSGYTFNSYGDYEPNININNNGVVGRLSSSPPPMQQFKRNRSHRIFSCISGV